MIVTSARWGLVLTVALLTAVGCKSQDTPPAKKAPAATDKGAQAAKPGTEEDKDPVVELQKACDGGSVAKCVELGDFLVDWKKDPDAARPHYKRACDIGHPNACDKLARLDNPPPKPTGDFGSTASLESACRGGDAATCNDIGLFMIRGSNGFDANKAGAKEYFELACSEGYSEGCNNLGYMYEIGDGVAQDQEKARDLYATSCDNDNVDGCAKLGFLLDTGQYHVQDKERAEAILKKACDKGSLQGCTNLGVVRITSLRDFTGAREAFDKACDGGHMRGCTKIGLMHYFGDGTEEDHAKALEYFDKACKNGSAGGCVGVGLVHKDGKAVKKDEDKAASLFEEACSQGNERGCKELERMGLR